MTYRKKLIEVALPLEAINTASAREKSIRHGHPSTLHLWWSRKPLATCRAVLFASLVDDPSEHPEDFPTEQAQEQERLRLFRLMEALIIWENSNNQEVLAQAQAEIRKSIGGNPPPLLDPFCGLIITHKLTKRSQKRKLERKSTRTGSASKRRQGYVKAGTRPLGDGRTESG